MRLIGKLKRILPISDVIIEVASFDTQKMQNPEMNVHFLIMAGGKGTRFGDAEKCMSPVNGKTKKNQPAKNIF